jgi:antitoxin HigA-1
VDIAGRLPVTVAEVATDSITSKGHSIRINDQWRICFTWTTEVRLMSKSSTITRRRPTEGVATRDRVTTHPGEVLSEEFLKPLGMSANARAMALRVPATRIGAIVKGERAVTADTALRLARFFRTSPEFWMGLQATHDLTKARRERGRAIERDVEPRAA